VPRLPAQTPTIDTVVAPIRRTNITEYY
jgi:hypothetical protein